MEFTENELRFLHCLLGGCDTYLIKHAMAQNKDYTEVEKEKLEESLMKLYIKINNSLNAK